MGAGGSTNNMGTSDSKQQENDSNNEPNSPTQKKIEKLQTANHDNIDPRVAKYLADRLTSSERETSFLKIILKLSSIGQKFLKLQEAFKKFDSNGDGVIDQKELAGALKILGADVTDEKVQSIFSVANVHDLDGLKLKEFIIGLSLAYLFGVVPVSEDGSVDLPVMTALDQQGIREAFDAGADMFLLFDDDASGTITLDEVVNVLQNMGNNDHAKKSNKKFSTGNNLSNVYIQRFKEFDWDSDGRIVFAEFLFAFIGWTDIDELIEEENDNN
jgi:Ca2+-binding EF-hand superfamily protein